MVDNIPAGTDSKHLIELCNNKKGITMPGLPHHRHIDLLKKFAMRGHGVIVWSAGGEDWAYYIVKTLGLLNVVDITVSKMDWFIDDLMADKVLKGRIYLDATNPLKDNRGWVSDTLDNDLDPSDLCDPVTKKLIK